ncbi:MAG: hypothetical protein EAZ18_27015 [Oscillatoriales cyanobacterium]|nr:MAG: hypothetical protein EAZ18_27015 [Oscillatoriales cyanobacterium]
MGWAFCPPKALATGKMPVPQIYCGVGILPAQSFSHRQDACATKFIVGWASSLPKALATGKMPVPQNSCGVGF